MKPSRLLSIVAILMVSAYASSTIADDRRGYNNKHNYSQEYKNKKRHDYFDRQEQKHANKHGKRPGHKHYRKHANKHAGKKHRRHNRHIDYARVIRVKPIYETVRIHQPQVQCRQVPVRKKRVHRVQYRTADHVVAGSILGGVIGHHVGNDHNRPFTTIAGSIIGAAIASEASDGHGYVEQDVYQEQEVYRQNCRQRDLYINERRVKGYRVTYKYKGEIYKTRMSERPGKRIPVEARVRPLRM